VFRDFQPHDVIQRQPTRPTGAIFFVAARRGPRVATVTHGHVVSAVVPTAIATTLVTARQASAITDVTVDTTAQPRAPVVRFVLLVNRRAGATRRGRIGGERVCVIGVAGTARTVAVGKLDEVATGHLHHPLYQGFVFLSIPLHFPGLLCFQILIAALNICSLGDLLGYFFPTRTILDNEAKQQIFFGFVPMPLSDFGAQHPFPMLCTLSTRLLTSHFCRYSFPFLLSVMSNQSSEFLILLLCPLIRRLAKPTRGSADFFIRVHRFITI